MEIRPEEKRGREDVIGQMRTLDRASFGDEAERRRVLESAYELVTRLELPSETNTRLALNQARRSVRFRTRDGC